MSSMKYICNARVRIIMLSVIVPFFFGCGIKTTVTDFVPQTFLPGTGAKAIEGSVNVRTIVPTITSNPSYVELDGLDRWIDSRKLKEAIEIAITQQEVFSEVSQGQADYILEVWIDKIQDMLEITGEGFIFDFTSVWRLTDTRDGKIIVCDFIKGHGAAHGMLSRAYPPSLSAATIDIIQKGLFAVSDRSQAHLTAISTAEKRPAIPAVLK